MRVLFKILIELLILLACFLAAATCLPTAMPIDTNEDFIPKDIGNAVEIGCTVSGIADGDTYAETQVFVKANKDSKVWDYKPIISRRTKENGGVYKAIDDCIKWYEDSKKQIKATVDAEKEHK
jgi:hypothetical protein